MQLKKIEGTLLSKQIPLPAGAMMLQAMFPEWYPMQAGIQLPGILLHSQMKISEQKWGLPSVHWWQNLEIFNPDPTKWTRTLQWISILLQQL